ncbi:unnamed protein product, partial [Effrenium voratum]
ALSDEMAQALLLVSDTPLALEERQSHAVSWRRMWQQLMLASLAATAGPCPGRWRTRRPGRLADHAHHADHADRANRRRWRTRRPGRLADHAHHADHADRANRRHPKPRRMSRMQLAASERTRK